MKHFHPAGRRPDKQSHPARGAWIETSTPVLTSRMKSSHPARGAWIETLARTTAPVCLAVAPREGCVD